MIVHSYDRVYILYGPLYGGVENYFSPFLRCVSLHLVFFLFLCCLVKPKIFFKHHRNVIIFHFKNYESLLVEDHRIAQEIQREEERDSE
jgi:hypothetical protein